MNNPEQIPLPQFRSATPLSAIELNRLRFGKGLTVLTPDRLRSIAGQTDSSTSTTAHPKSNDDRGRTASPHAVASIHTPAPEMQLMTVFLAIFSNSVSIHTPAWGATRTF